MSKIYEPKGKAREYSPLVLNYYKGCSHECLFLEDIGSHTFLIQKVQF